MADMTCRLCGAPCEDIDICLRCWDTNVESMKVPESDEPTPMTSWTAERQARRRRARELQDDGLTVDEIGQALGGLSRRQTYRLLQRAPKMQFCRPCGKRVSAEPRGRGWWKCPDGHIWRTIVALTT